MHADGTCVQNITGCNTYETGHICSSCYDGWVIVDGICVIDDNRDNLCARWNDNVCVSCADRAYFGNNGRCH